MGKAKNLFAQFKLKEESKHFQVVLRWYDALHSTFMTVTHFCHHSFAFSSRVFIFLKTLMEAEGNKLLELRDKQNKTRWGAKVKCERILYKADRNASLFQRLKLPDFHFEWLEELGSGRGCSFSPEPIRQIFRSQSHDPHDSESNNNNIVLLHGYTNCRFGIGIE